MLYLFSVQSRSSDKTGDQNKKICDKHYSLLCDKTKVIAGQKGNMVTGRRGHFSVNKLVQCPCSVHAQSIESKGKLYAQFFVCMIMVFYTIHIIVDTSPN